MTPQVRHPAVAQPPTLSAVRIATVLCLGVVLTACTSQPNLAATQVWAYLDKRPQCLDEALYCSAHTFKAPEDLSKGLRVRWKRHEDGVLARLKDFQLYMEPREIYGIPGGYQVVLYGPDQSDSDRRVNEFKMLAQLLDGF